MSQHPQAGCDHIVGDSGLVATSPLSSPSGHAATDVVILRWPEQAEDVARLNAAGTPRLLLVDPTAAPPVSSSCLQDWIRLPASDADVRARLAALAGRVGHEAPAVSIDDAGRLHFRGAWVALSPIEERIARTMVDNLGAVVAEDDLIRAGWPDEPPSGNAVRVHFTRLRQRLQPLGLELHSVRGHGKLIEVASDPPAP